MRPLDESLRAPAANRPGTVAECSGSARGRTGAFGEAIADAGAAGRRGKAARHLPMTRDGNPVANGGNASAVTKVDGFGADDPAFMADAAAPDARPASGRAIVTPGQAPKSSQARPPCRQPHLSRNVKVAKRKSTSRRSGGDPLAWIGCRLAREPLMKRPVVMAREGGENGDPASGTVSDLLSMLAGAAPRRPRLRIRKAGQSPPRRVREGSDGLAKTVGGISPEAADGEHPQIGEMNGDSEPDRLFRFARADGKGQAVSMSISRDGERAAVENSRSSVKSGVETVTVLEARRYLGLALNENGASVTSAIAGDSGWAEALQSSAATTKPEAWSQPARRSIR